MDFSLIVCLNVIAKISFHVFVDFISSLMMLDDEIN